MGWTVGRELRDGRKFGVGRRVAEGSGAGGSSGGHGFGSRLRWTGAELSERLECNSWEKETGISLDWVWASGNWSWRERSWFEILRGSVLDLGSVLERRLVVQDFPGIGLGSGIGLGEKDGGSGRSCDRSWR